MTRMKFRRKIPPDPVSLKKIHRKQLHSIDEAVFFAIVKTATVLGAYWFRSGQRVGGGMPRMVRWPR